MHWASWQPKPLHPSRFPISRGGTETAGTGKEVASQSGSKIDRRHGTHTPRWGNGVKVFSPKIPRLFSFLYLEKNGFLSRERASCGRVGGYFFEGDDGDCIYEAGYALLIFDPDCSYLPVTTRSSIVVMD